MDRQNEDLSHQALDELYAEAGHWHVNTGDEKIHAKRMPGRFRQLKNWANAFWLILFLGPFLRWDGRQAVLFDIPERQYHLFGVTVLPQDFWMLALVLLFFAILLAMVTSIAGRVWCGYFCFQTVWTDLYTWVEQRFEGNPLQRRRLDAAPLSGAKLARKTGKHAIWLAIAFLTGVSFVAWFVDVFKLWEQIFTLQAHPVVWVTIAVFAGFTYLFAGFMREQVCFWLCPYARIQGVMVDENTILPTYDFNRGEPRGRMAKNRASELGDCVDCNQCVAVCPTGVDIRHGQQEGCITCGLCIDACDSVMDKVQRPRGLIRYASLDEIKGAPHPGVWRRPRVLVYTAIMLLSLVGIVYGLSSVGAIELKVLHSRQPLFVLQSDGSIQNGYTLKILNKTTEDLNAEVSAQGPQGLRLVGLQNPVALHAGQVTALKLFARAPRKALEGEVMPLVFEVNVPQSAELQSRYESIFVGPKP